MDWTKAKHWTEEARKAVVGYARVSTKRQGQDGISLTAQKSAIQEFCNCMGYHLIEVYEDVASGVGAESFARRKGLNDALDLMKGTGANLVVWNQSRLSRYDGFIGQLREKLDDLNAVIFVEEANRLSHASSEAKIALQQQEALEIRRRTKEAMAEMKALGFKFGNPNILNGVQQKGVSSWSKKSANLVEQIAEIVRSNPELKTKRYDDVAEVLNSKGLLTGHKNQWTKSKVRKPFKKALKLIEAEKTEQHEADPTFGMF